MTDTALMPFEAALPLMKAGARIARLGWKLDGKHLEYQPVRSYVTDDGEHRTLAASIVMRYPDGTWGQWEYSARSLLADDWFVGASGDLPRPEERALDAPEPCGCSEGRAIVADYANPSRAGA
ncbi:MW1434 family type I TA system toxin [Streptomyces sp. NPDC060194]|uniref:Thoeris anti-defense Tad2 family protein n=1 Tax=Streptomyces sp. NPDC060194 TaxID=3347069 RepID=UPI00365CA531